MCKIDIFLNIQTLIGKCFLYFIFLLNTVTFFFREKNGCLLLGKMGHAITKARVDSSNKIAF